MNTTTKLNWKVAESNSTNQLFELKKDSDTVLSLNYFFDSHNAQLRYAGKRRIFHVEQEGLFAEKSAFFNEYGIKIGQLLPINWLTHSGVIEFIDYKVYYSTQNNPNQELIIYKDSKQKPLLVCSIDNSVNTHNANSSKVAWNEEKNASLLLAICWYLISNFEKNPS